MKSLSPRVLAMAAGLLLAAGAAVAAPQLTIDDSTFDFGFAPQHSKLTHVFWLHSTGDDSLKIEKIVPGCGCTQAPVEKDQLAVGDSTRLEIIFDTRRYSHHVTKRPKITTNEGPPDKFVQIQSTVVSRPDSTYPVIIRPYKIDLSQLSDKVRDEMRFTISNVSEDDLNITLVSGAADFFSVNLPNRVAAGQETEAVLTLTDLAIEQSFEKSLTFELSDKSKSRFTIPVKRMIRKVPEKQPAAAVGKTSNGH